MRIGVQAYASALARGGAEGVDDESADAPIIAALVRVSSDTCRPPARRRLTLSRYFPARQASHNGALDAAEDRATEIEAELRLCGRGPRFAHAAQVVEVRLTDQLLQLQQMLDDCTTSEGRQAVKRVVVRLRAVGTRLLAVQPAGRAG